MHMIWLASLLHINMWGKGKIRESRSTLAEQIFPGSAGGKKKKQRLRTEVKEGYHCYWAFFVGGN